MKFHKDFLTCLGIVDNAMQVDDGVGGEYLLQQSPEAFEIYGKSK